MATMRDGFASLSAGLLARKGAARPAMRPQGGGLDDLGWNDMAGGEPPAAPKRQPITFAVPAVPEVVRQQDAIAREFGVAPIDAAPAPETGKRTAFTLRLDPARRQRLRLLAAAERRSAQSLVTEALDRLLGEPVMEGSSS